MSASKLLAVVATILFVVAFVVSLTDGDRDLVAYCLYLGLASFAAAHWAS